MSGSQRPSKPRPPANLRGAGKSLWRDVMATFDLSAHERRVLQQCCACLDAIETLERLVKADGAMVDGSKGQPVLHPALAEARQQRLAFGRLLAQLQLPDDEGGTMSTPTQLQARRAAQARWSQERAAHGA